MSEQNKEEAKQEGPDVYGLRLRPLRENCQATRVVAIVEYIDMSDGVRYIAAKYSDDVAIWDLVGMVETIKSQTLHDFINLPDDPDLDV